MRNTRVRGTLGSRRIEELVQARARALGIDLDLPDARALLVHGRPGCGSVTSTSS